MKLRKITLTQRIMLGVSVLVILAISFGGVAVWKLVTSNRDARFLSEVAVVPETCANSLSLHLGLMRLASRTYGLTGDPRELATVQREIATVRATMSPDCNGSQLMSPMMPAEST